MGGLLQLLLLVASPATPCRGAQGRDAVGQLVDVLGRGVGEAVDEGDAQLVVVLVRVGILALGAAAGGWECVRPSWVHPSMHRPSERHAPAPDRHDPLGPEGPEERAALAGVDDEEELPEAAHALHLLQGAGLPRHV